MPIRTNTVIRPLTQQDGKNCRIYFDRKTNHLPDRHTSAMAVGMRLPPDAPTMSCTAPSLFTTITGAMEDMGRFPGAIKLVSDGGNPK